MILKKGFTLIELLITAFILSTGIVTVLAIFPISSHIIKSGEMVTTAVLLSQGKLEEVTSKSYEEIFSLTEDYGQINGFEAYKRVTDVQYYDPQTSTVTTTDMGIKQVKVTVSWKSPFGSLEKSTYLANLITER
jgi:prepilin-type N-terminal cleavage/methylation domain-containing protein